MKPTIKQLFIFPIVVSVILIIVLIIHMLKESIIAIIPLFICILILIDSIMDYKNYKE